MITTTFSYDNCISTYSLVVDRSKTTVTQRWLSNRGVKYRTQFEGKVTVIKFHITNAATDVIAALTKKFVDVRTASASTSVPAESPVESPLTATQFRRTTRGYELIVDNAYAIATTAWLEAKGCAFDRYISNGTTRYAFISISGEALTAIAAKHRCIVIAAPVVQAPTPVEVVVPVEVCVVPVEVIVSEPETLVPVVVSLPHTLPLFPTKVSAIDAITSAIMLEDKKTNPSKLTRNVYLKLLRGTASRSPSLDRQYILRPCQQSTGNPTEGIGDRLVFTPEFQVGILRKV